MVYAIATDLQDDVYPARVLVTVTGLTDTEDVRVYRSVAGERTLIRGGDAYLDGAAFLALDAELPFGVPVTYVADVDGVDYATSATTYDLTGAKVVISDAIQALAAEVVILSWPDKAYNRDTSVFRLGNGRTVVVSGPGAQFTGTIELFTESDSQRGNVQTLLQAATANTIQVRQAGGYEDVDCYVSVLSHIVRRFSQDGSDPRRVFVLDVAETDAWEDGLTAQGYTYADLEDVYTGLTYSNLASDFATYLDLARAELTP